MIGDALMDSLGGALGGSSGAEHLPPPRAKVSRGGGAPSAGGFGAELVALLTGPAQPDPLTAALVEAEVHLLPAPALAACRLHFLPGNDFPALAAGDVLKLQARAPVMIHQRCSPARSPSSVAPVACSSWCSAPPRRH